MNPKERRAITQTTGARVKCEGDTGTVVGHYDDDIVFVRFDGGNTERVWTNALTLIIECE